MAKKKKLKIVEWRTGTIAEFLGLTPAQAYYIKIRVALINSLSSLREQKRITQEQLAKLIKSSQSRVAKMEAGDPTVSLDLLFRAILALGVSAEELLKHLLKEVNPYSLEKHASAIEDWTIETASGVLPPDMRLRRAYTSFKGIPVGGTLASTITQSPLTYMGEKPHWAN